MGKKNKSKGPSPEPSLANVDIADATNNASNITNSAANNPPKLTSRRANRQSAFRMGRTIGEQREHLETANERAAARKKDKKRQARRTTFAIIGFSCLIVVLVLLGFIFVGNGRPAPDEPIIDEPVSLEPTITIVDEDATSGGEKITNRMRLYVGQAEQDFRDLGLQPIKAVIPTGTIREIDFYLDGHPGFIKMNIDRDSAVSVEDAERMLRYLASIEVSEFQYIDVRISGKAYWR